MITYNATIKVGDATPHEVSFDLSEAGASDMGVDYDALIRAQDLADGATLVALERMWPTYRIMFVAKAYRR